MKTRLITLALLLCLGANAFAQNPTRVTAVNGLTNTTGKVTGDVRVGIDGFAAASTGDVPKKSGNTVVWGAGLAATNAVIVATNYVSTIETLTPGVTVNLDMSTSFTKTLINATNFTFTVSNAAAGRQCEVHIKNDATARTVTWPSWTANGTALPATIPASKWTVVYVKYVFSSADTNAIATVTSQP